MECRRFFLSIFIALVLTGCSVYPDLEKLSGNHALGIPAESDQLLEKRGFTLGYNNIHRQALWVSYILEADKLHAEKVKRKNVFYTDKSIKKFPIKPQEYNKSGYDRGHLAPAADMAYSDESMTDSFFMSNISPQLPVCNRRNMLAVENLIRKWALTEKRIYVVTGPVFGNRDNSFGDPPITVPSAFYKAVLDLTPPYKMIALIVPNANCETDIENWAVSVDELEELTGYDFFSELDDDTENTFEKQFDLTDWEK